MSIESVGSGSSQSEFGTSVSSTMLAWASEISPSGSWINLYVPSANRVTSIWNAIVGKNSKVLYLSIAFLRDKKKCELTQSSNPDYSCQVP